jgi:uncharacterized protein (TIGR00290 family)
MEKILFGWSGGKDSAYALNKLLVTKQYDITLLTTITEEYKRISMHGVREGLLERQAEYIGLPLVKVYINANEGNTEYEAKMQQVMHKYKSQGYNRMAFGDLFLADIRAYRESNLAKIGMEALFPLWNYPTAQMASDFIADGYKTIITCVDTRQISGAFSGRLFNTGFINELPVSADKCGENGEFHSFVFDGPIFKKPINIKTGEQMLRNEYFMFTDIIEVL